ncbi:MAG: hypothetical protein ACT4OX_01135 [Actinomycetota bacterium]
MGQPITVSARAGGRPDVRFFDTNRSLTGMAIESYAAAPPTDAQRPPDVLARRLFALGATRVTVYSNVATVEAPAAAWAELEPKIVHTLEHLFEFYGDEAGWSFEARGVPYTPSPVK